MTWNIIQYFKSRHIILFFLTTVIVELVPTVKPKEKKKQMYKK